MLAAVFLASSIVVIVTRMSMAVPMILLTVYYESLSPDTKNFFNNQLLRTMEELSQFIKVELIPYGKATTYLNPQRQFMFMCEHGETECIGNKIHACSIHRAKDDLTRVRLATCMLNDDYMPYRIGQQCCNKYGINWDAVMQCVDGDEGSIRLNHFGQLTNSLNPPITFIPTVLINKDGSGQELILNSLLDVIIKHLNTRLDPSTEIPLFVPFSFWGFNS